MSLWASQRVPAARDALRQWIAACLTNGVNSSPGEFPLEEAAAEGVLPWLAYRLHDAGALAALPEQQQEGLHDVLRRWNLLHLDCETELERLLHSASDYGLHFFAFKGHSVARTLYPHPACRPTSDFDLMVDPRQVPLAQTWLACQGYTPSDPYAGTLWLGQQAWWLTVDGNTRFALDLHWDYTNRMHFRKRLTFDEIWAVSREVACGDTILRVPCRVDEMIFACVHLAALDPGEHVCLIWLLDVNLLMASLDGPKIALLLERAGKAHAIEFCLAYGEIAAALDNGQRLQPVLEALRQAADVRHTRHYQHTLRWRLWDLACYWGRLPAAEKLRFFGDLARWIRVRG